MINIFSYMDYRAYLRDVYAEKKKTLPGFSFRTFSRDAGFTSPSFLKMVMDGQRNMSIDSTRRFATALRLPPGERKFFIDLVLFTQATDHEEKDRCCRRLATYRHFLKAQRMTKEHLKYFSRWYYAAITEMTLLQHFREDPEWISRQLTPQITPEKAREAIADLVRLGILTRDENRRLMPSKTDLTAESGVRSIALMNYHRSMCLCAAHALAGNKPHNRNHITITAAISPEKFQEARRRMETFRHELCELFSGPDDAKAVYQVNLQLFHLTEVPDAAS